MKKNKTIIKNLFCVAEMGRKPTAVPPEPLMSRVRSPESVPAAHFLALASAASVCVAIKSRAVADFAGVCDRHAPLKRKSPVSVAHRGIVSFCHHKTQRILLVFNQMLLDDVTVNVLHRRTGPVLFESAMTAPLWLCEQELERPLSSVKRAEQSKAIIAKG